MRLLLLGPPTIEVDGRSRALPFERRSQLIAHLALRREWVARSELASMMWPDQPAKQAFMNLRKTLHRLQGQPWTLPVQVDGGSLRLEVDTDVVAFEAALQHGDEVEALHLRRGVLLDGFDDDASSAWSSWLAFERDRLQTAWRDAAMALLRADVGPTRALALCAQLLASDPLDEAAASAQVTWLARSGQGAKAREAYREFEDRLRTDLGVRPSAEMQALQGSLSASSAAADAAAAASGVAADPEFIGRAAELNQLRELLAQPDCRLLSLVGPGGIGKTRLALRLMQLAAGETDTADSVWVSLEDVTAAIEVGGRIAQQLGMALAGGGDALSQVVAAIGRRPLLLVLDNVEQLAPGAAFVMPLLAGCPRLKIVVTTRVRLGLDAERLFPLDGLPCPEAEDIDRLEAFDAARLFVRTAQRVEPALVPQAEAEAIVEICRLVEGQPLALVLAAGWARMLSCASIAEEIRRGTELLRSADPTRAARHASIEAVFEQSWRLLSDAERRALARLSVFRGGASPDAARSVTGAALPVLASLADKSLLRKDGARLAMHALVQLQASLRLGDGADTAASEQAHAAFFRSRMLQWRRGAENGDGGTLAQIEADFDNCRHAWRTLVAAAAADALRDGLTTLSQFLEHRCRLGEALALMLEALSSPELRSDVRLTALLQAHAAHHESRLDRYREAGDRATRAAELARQAGEPEAELWALRALGVARLRMGDYARARASFEAALRLAPLETDPRTAADMNVNLASTLSYQGDYAAALRHAEVALPIYRQLGDVAGEASCRNSMGVQLLWLCDFDGAALHLNAGLELSTRHGLVMLRAQLSSGLVEAERKRGDFDAAERHMRIALPLAESNGYRALSALLGIDRVHIALYRRDLPLAREALASAMELALAIGRPTLLAAGLACLAEILAAQGETDAAGRVMRLAIDHPGTNAPERDSLRGRLQAWGPSAVAAGAEVPAIDGESLMRRLIAEAGLPNTH